MLAKRIAVTALAALAVAPASGAVASPATDPSSPSPIVQDLRSPDSHPGAGIVYPGAGIVSTQDLRSPDARPGGAPSATSLEPSTPDAVPANGPGGFDFTVLAAVLALLSAAGLATSIRVSRRRRLTATH